MSDHSNNDRICNGVRARAIERMFDVMQRAYQEMPLAEIRPCEIRSRTSTTAAAAGAKRDGVYDGSTLNLVPRHRVRWTLLRDRLPYSIDEPVSSEPTAAEIVPMSAGHSDDDQSDDYQSDEEVPAPLVRNKRKWRSIGRGIFGSRALTHAWVTRREFAMDELRRA